MRNLKRIISLFCLCAILFCAFSPIAFAADVVSDVQTAVSITNLADWAFKRGTQAFNFLDYLATGDESICAASPVLGGRHSFKEVVAPGLLQGTLDTYYECEWCSLRYNAYIFGDNTDEGDSEGGGSSGSGLYGAYTDSLPLNGYSSEGTFLWYPTVDDVKLVDTESYSYFSVLNWCSTRRLNSLPYFTFRSPFEPFSSYLIYTLLSDRRTIDVGFHSSGTCNVHTVGLYDLSLIAPVDGTYSLLDTRIADYYIMDLDGNYYQGSVSSSSSPTFSSASYSLQHVLGGDTVSFSSGYAALDIDDCIIVNGAMYFPVFSVRPDVTVLADKYAPNTRMGNVTFDFGVTNGDTITNVTNNYIVNEGDNIYTNPVTGEEKQITNWNYNYDDRSYELHLADGMTARVEFGDLNVNIDEISIGEDGSTTTNNYTVYYVIDNGSGGGGDVDPSPSPSPSPSQPDTPPSTLSRVFQNYGNKITQHYGHEGHNGVDVIPTSGVADTVIAHSEGEVVTIQTGQVNNTETTGAATWGNYVKIKHPNGMYTLYAHLANVAVKEGDYVTQGQPLGLMGDSGRAFGAHLHFEVYEDETTRIDPEPYLNADLPGLGSDDGWSWWKGAWSDFRSWLSGLFGNSDPETVFVPGVDSGADGEDSEWSFLDLLKAVVDGVWSFIKGIPGAIFGGLSGLIDGLFGIGDFFNSYKLDNPDGVFNILYKGGADIWD